jgi:hypothetical protein
VRLRLTIRCVASVWKQATTLAQPHSLSCSSTAGAQPTLSADANEQLLQDLQSAPTAVKWFQRLLVQGGSLLTSDALRKLIDGTFPPPDASADDVYLSASTTKYRMETTSDIRILKLLPRSFSDPLHCVLRVAAIKTNPVYNALLYMRGDLSPTGRIILNSEAFPITRLLKNALRHVRLQDSVRCL